MFCKFCGETMDPSQTKCRRCGREVPASSNCGGYYDVVKELNKQGITDPNNPPQVYVTQKAPESKLWVFTMICALLLVAVLFVQLLLWRKVDSMNEIVEGYDPCECGSAVSETTEDVSAGEQITEEETDEDKKKPDGKPSDKDNEEADASDEAAPEAAVDESVDMLVDENND